MIKALEHYINEHRLIKNGDKIILTISGGIDSVVMLDLFAKLKYDVCVAHCNFHLRGDASDLDEQLVQKLAEHYNLKFNVKHFNTEKFAKDNKLSIQVAARELRYHWFEELRQELNYELIATAHHSDDQIETLLINLSRGTGIRGLSGIKAKYGNIIRPLLFASKKKIEDYQQKNNLEYREDESNQSVKYYRNAIRHKLIPEFKRINPEFAQNIQHTISILNQTEQVLNQEIERFVKETSRKENDRIVLDIKKILNFSPLEIYMYEFLSKFGFNATQVKDIILTLNSQPGKIFKAKRNSLVKDRDSLIIYKENNRNLSIEIEENTAEITEPIHLYIKTIEYNQNTKVSSDTNLAYLDKDKLVFPLNLRKWQHGDKFRPLGMKGFKKLSDFFTDIKLSQADKENVYVLESEGEIVWVIGYRIDDRYKITDSTMTIVLYKYTG